MFDYTRDTAVADIEKDMSSLAPILQTATLGPADCLYIPQCSAPIDKVGTGNNVGLLKRFVPSTTADKYACKEQALAVIDCQICGVSSWTAGKLLALLRSGSGGSADCPAKKRKASALLAVPTFVDSPATATSSANSSATTHHGVASTSVATSLAPLPAPPPPPPTPPPLQVMEVNTNDVLGDATDEAAAADSVSIAADCPASNKAEVNTNHVVAQIGDATGEAAAAVSVAADVISDSDKDEVATNHVVPNSVAADEVDANHAVDKAAVEEVPFIAETTANACLASAEDEVAAVERAVSPASAKAEVAAVEKAVSSASAPLAKAAAADEVNTERSQLWGLLESLHAPQPQLEPPTRDLRMDTTPLEDRGAVDGASG